MGGTSPQQRAETYQSPHPPYHIPVLSYNDGTGIDNTNGILDSAYIL